MQIKRFICASNYKKLIRKLKLLKRPLKVVFIVFENSKWRYQSLYDAMAKSNKFEPLILVGELFCVHTGKDKIRKNLEENYNFFKLKGMNVEYLYKNKNYIDLKFFKPDVVFYEQPYELPSKYKPVRVSQYALTCYCDYGLDIFETYKTCTSNFHNLLWKFFVINEFLIKRYKTQIKNADDICVNCGYLKLDAYFQNDKINYKNIWKNPEKIKIIYAPHHSFEKSGLNLATFKEYGELVLSMAKKHTETTWVFKPHPRFKYALLKNSIMSENEIDKYYQEWENIGHIYTSGNYIDIFKTSDFMITDCVSFLGEYLPTGKPVINLLNSNNTIKYNDFGQILISKYYQVTSKENFISVFNTLLKGIDTKFDSRLELRKIIIDCNQKSCDKIMSYLETNLKS